MHTKELRLVLGDQLNINHTWFKRVDPSICYVLMEVRSESEYVNHHIQKVVAIFSAMRQFAALLANQGHQVKYIKITDPNNQHDFNKNLIKICEELNTTEILIQQPDEYRLDHYFKQSKLPISVVDSEHFLTTRAELEEFFKGKKTYLMESFYRYMRKKFQILIEGDQPKGGQWNFDHDNRKKLPAQAAIFTTALSIYDVTEVFQDMFSNTNI